MKLIRSEFENVSRFNDKFIIDFIAEKRVYEEEIEGNIVSRINKNIYTLNTLAFLGINASGKTTTIKLISEMIKIFINNESLDYNFDLKNFFEDYIVITNYIYNNNMLYKIQSRISKNSENQKMIFDDEKIYVKKINKSTTKKSLFDFRNVGVDTERDNVNSEFLKDEDSIFSSVLNPFIKRGKMISRDLIDQTNFNFITTNLKNIPTSFINFLDSSIENFEQITDDNINFDQPPKYKIKFKGEEKEIISSVFDLEKYLSSGTIKGVNLLTHITKVLETGGYFIVDEFENHLNKAIVTNLIKLFNSPINVHSATLIFSTHYSEIIDSITRTDSIYILKKTKYIEVLKFSDLLKNNDRKDKRKSDFILSGMFGTAPSYHSYAAVKKELKSLIERGAYL